MKLLVFAAVLALAAAESRPQYHPAPAPAYPQTAYGPAKGYGHPEDYSAPSPYQFDYAVNDHYNGAVFSQNEQGDDYGNVQGYYSVNLPDGRVQHVKYVANDYGNNAEVTYEGEAQYPEYHPAPAYKAAPAYKPAPAYSPAPAYKPAPAYRAAYAPAPAYRPKY